MEYELMLGTDGKYHYHYNDIKNSFCGVDVSSVNVIKRTFGRSISTCPICKERYEELEELKDEKE